MLSYHNNPELKAKTVAEVIGHRMADRIIKSYYWSHGRRRAVGCLLKSENYIEYEERFGIPVALARLKYTIFEQLPNYKARLWPERFMSAVPIGADLSRVYWRFLRWLGTEKLKVKGEGKIFDDVLNAIVRCATVAAEIETSAHAARDAAHAAHAAYAASAAANAAHAATRYARENRAACTAYDAAYAAYAADFAADAVADAANATRAARDASALADRTVAYAALAAIDAAFADHYAAHSACYELISDKLIELIIEQDPASEEKGR